MVAPMDRSPIPYLPASRGPDGEIIAAAAISMCGAAPRPELQARVHHGEPVGLVGDRLAAEERQDDGQRLVLHVALAQGVDAEHHRVRRQRARAHPEHRAAARLVVELLHAVGDDVAGGGRAGTPRRCRGGCAWSARRRRR